MRQQVEFYEGEVRKLEQKITQQKLDYTAQIDQLQAQVKTLTSQVEAAANSPPAQSVDQVADDYVKQVVEKAKEASGKLESENQDLKQTIAKLEAELKEARENQLALQASLNDLKPGKDGKLRLEITPDDT